MDISAWGGVIISVHIPKTAGSTFYVILRNLFGNKLYHDRPQHLQKDRLKDDTKCIHGHFLASKWLKKFPDAALVTWVRHPVDRVISEYYYKRDRATEMLDTPTMGDITAKQIRDGDMTLSEFICGDGETNRQSRYLDVPLLRFAFIGIAEHFDAMLPDALAVMSAKPIQYDNQLVNPDKRCDEPYHIPRRLRKRIEELNADDMALYTAVKELNSGHKPSTRHRADGEKTERSSA